MIPETQDPGPETRNLHPARGSKPPAEISAFRDRFGSEPTLVVRAPGRVNLIGEHTDYNGLPVLPFAIRQSHRLAAGEGADARIEIANVDSCYRAQTIAVDDLVAFSPPGEWDNYLRAAILGLTDGGLVRREKLARGLRLLVASDLPSGVGLSSSSALVVGFALAALHVWGAEYGRLRLAEVLAEAEHYVGTRGGGMDQAICLLGQEGHALKIDFFPLQVEPVAFAGDIQVYLADSGVRVEKSGEGRALYNRRPIECRLALALFKKSLTEKGPPQITGRRPVPAEWRDGLAQAKYWGDLIRPPLDLAHETVLAMIGETFGQSSYSMEDLSRQLGLTEAAVRETYLKIAPGDHFSEPADGFRLRQRTEHVIAEGRRVEQAVEALRSADWPQLADLINASHASCRDLHEISCPELERLVEAAAEAGALGSRLTGAGFGGCTLHVVRSAEADRFESAMRRQLGESLKLLRVAPSQRAEVLSVS